MADLGCGESGCAYVSLGLAEQEHSTASCGLTDQYREV